MIRYISIAKTKFMAMRLGIALNLPFLYWKKKMYAKFSTMRAKRRSFRWKRKLEEKSFL